MTPNVDHLIKLQKDEGFYKIYQKADWVICDSNIVQLGLKFLNKPVKEVIPGSSFLPAYYNYHRENREIKIFLLGSMEGVADKAKSRINRKVGWDIVVGAHSPSFGFEERVHGDSKYYQGFWSECPCCGCRGTETRKMDIPI